MPLHRRPFQMSIAPSRRIPLLATLALMLGAWTCQLLTSSSAYADEALPAARIEFEHQILPNMPYVVTRADWLPSDEAQFDKFIGQLGQAIAHHKCNSVKTCMRNPAINMYASQDPAGVTFYSDCAEFPYFLRAYFAYHNHLPFSYANNARMNLKPVASMNDHDNELPNKSPANGPYGNTIISRSRSNVAAAIGDEPNLIPFIVNMFDNVSTRMFRTSALSQNYGLLSDLYPVKINRGGIHSGTLVHSTGHVMIVWSVDAQGGVNVFDGHPDGTVQSKKIQSANLDRARPDQNLGFLRFRSLHLVGAEVTASGEMIGGKVVPEADSVLIASGKYSLEQWFGPGSNVLPGQKIDPNAWKHAFANTNFFDFLATRLRASDVVINAVDAINDRLNSLCLAFKDRVVAVNQATAKSTQLLPHPVNIPGDLYGEDEETVWAPFSSPGRDGVLRAMAQDVVSSAIDDFKRAKSGAKDITFDGDAVDYAQALSTRLSAFDQSCQVSFHGSDNKVVTVSLSRLLSSLNLMSYDPYDCPEKRWGIYGQPGTQCVDGDPQGLWYKAEQYSRNSVGKLTLNEVAVVRSDRPITLELLRNPSLIDRPDTDAINLGTKQIPQTDLKKIFGSQSFLDRLAN